ncbi:MAG: sigma-70 family RNA polymerase sigma factor [Pirellula sp.]
MQELLDLLETDGPRVHVLLTKLTGRVDAAEDLLQELFLKLSRSSGFKTAPNHEAYLLRSAIHIAFDWRKQNRKLVSLDDSKIEITQPGISPVDGLIHAEMVGKVLRALEVLSDNDRELLCMRFLEETSNETLATHYGVTVHQVRSKCSKAMARLRRILQSDRVNIANGDQP